MSPDEQTMVEIHCSAEATPQALVYWIKDGDRLQAGPKYQISTNTTQLFISDLNVTTDLDTYTCTAINPLGNKTVDTTLLGMDPFSIIISNNRSGPFRSLYHWKNLIKCKLNCMLTSKCTFSLSALLHYNCILWNNSQCYIINQINAALVNRRDLNIKMVWKLVHVFEFCSNYYLDVDNSQNMQFQSFFNLRPSNLKFECFPE